VEQNIYMTQYNMKPIDMDIKDAFPGAAEMSENVMSDELVFTSPPANHTMDDETKVDLAEVPRLNQQQ